MSSKKHSTLRTEALFFFASSPCRQLRRSVDHVIRVSTTYDAFGRMVEKNVSGTFTQILYSPIGKTATMSGQSTTNAYFPLPAGETLFETGSTGGNRFFWHKDWLGTVRFESNMGTRASTNDRAFAPFGEMYNNFGTTGNLSFTGDTQDTISGMFDTPNRELHPNQGRWISPDPAGLGAVDPRNPQTWNRYAYVGNNPTGVIDPLGLKAGMCGSRENLHCGSDPEGQNTGSGTGSWNEFDVLQWALTAYENVPISPDGLAYYPYGWLDAATGNLYPPGVYVFGLDWNNATISFPFAWALDLVGNTNVDTTATTGRSPANHGQQDSNSPKEDCKGTTSPPGTIPNIVDTFSRITGPLDLLAVNATFFIFGGGAVVAGGAAIGLGCAEPTPAEPLTCAVGIAGGAPTIAGGTFLMKQGVDFFKNNTLPAIKNWGCPE